MAKRGLAAMDEQIAVTMMATMEKEDGLEEQDSDSESLSPFAVLEQEQELAVTANEVLRRIDLLAASFVQALDQRHLPGLLAFSGIVRDGYDNVHSGRSSLGGNHSDIHEYVNLGDGTGQSVEQQQPRMPRQKEEENANLLKSNLLRKDFSLAQARSLTSIALVLDYCYQLLLSQKTTTVREVYYANVTHFRNQNECDIAIRDAAVLLQVPRYALGLHASSKGWFCGDVQFVQTRPPIPLKRHGREHDARIEESDAANSDDDESNSQDSILLDGRQLWHAANGSIVGTEWLEPSHRRHFAVRTEAAHCILVIEKEGIYRRLAQDRFFDKWPCIMVTGKGFPDLATRAFVHVLHRTLKLPVWGLADGNPFGALVLYTYAKGSDRRGVDGGNRFSVPIQWIGLRWSQMKALLSSTSLPSTVVQPLTPIDVQRLSDNLLDEKRTHGWVDTPDDEINQARWTELQDLLEGGRKMELEALHWLGVSYLSQWLGQIFAQNLQVAESTDDDDADLTMPHFKIL
jgi:meiotic recombination protein SPO11